MAEASRKVVRVTQSPMNPKQWALDLDCGHDLYVTAKGKPARKFAICHKCAADRSRR